MEQALDRLFNGNFVLNEYGWSEKRWKNLIQKYPNEAKGYRELLKNEGFVRDSTKYLSPAFYDSDLVEHFAELSMLDATGLRQFLVLSIGLCQKDFLSKG
ncbi:hypothetical protein [Helicobacter pylori]|uniref:hypothetical protein n=1 Tax=Helicobacter pylori TaxID=210 RepID=UPI00034810AE|nr:hypothetical protein [Helicobacter pylori]